MRMCGGFGDHEMLTLLDAKTSPIPILDAARPALGWLIATG